MSKAPAFMFYPKDFLTDERVNLMSYTEKGIYITLLSKCWLEGSLPASVDSIAKLLEIPVQRFRKIWSGPIGQCFTPTGDGRLTQRRLEEERTKQESYRRRQSDKGKASAEARFNRGSTAVQPSAVQPEGNSSLAVSSLQFPKQPTAASAAPKGRPLPGFRRLRIFRWMAEDMIAALGAHLESFDLDAWLQSVDEDDRRVFPETWPWIKTELLAECASRGLPIATASAGPTNKRIAGLVAGGERFLRGEA